ncbi:hypothetical protein [Streptomyces sp. Tue6028]|uniref:hypothetical protein n=1 Tax=Streptomyces sp. Tue6028 TaxID=2036037 RepID=UPI003D7533AC
MNAGIEEQQPSEVPAGSDLTIVDRYYLAWKAYQDLHGEQPSGKELSAHLARNRITGRDGSPVSQAAFLRSGPP